MGYIKLLDNNQFIFCQCENLYENMVQINGDITTKYLQGIQSGKVFKLKNIDGTTFEEIFEEYSPVLTTQPPSQEERILALEALMLEVL